jgi:hypothetical protein
LGQVFAFSEGKAEVLRTGDIEKSPVGTGVAYSVVMNSCKRQEEADEIGTGWSKVSQVESGA